MRHVVVFCHIEKCAGTSLIKKSLQEIPFGSVGVLSKSNKVDIKDLKKLKRLYGRPQIITGHSLTPTSFTDLKDVFAEIKTFTIFRDPFSRVISNYLHDKTRGVWDGSLSEFVSIPWKQNYMLRFLGGGDVKNGHEGFKAIDYKISVKNLKRSLPILINELNLPLTPDLVKKNSYQQNQSILPSDLSVENGVKIGNYSISQENYNLIKDFNALDIDFYDSALKEEEIWLSHVKTTSTIPIQVPIQVPKKTNRFLMRIAWVYRNIIYKPYVLGQFGPHRLPRNGVTPSLISSHDAF